MTTSLQAAKKSTPYSARSLVIRASAGTGKTFQLTNCLLRLFLRGTPPRSILATTFTRKAAGEILDRVLERLAAATASDVKTNDLAAQIGIVIASREKVVLLLSRLVRQIDQLRISTLDSYFQKAAQSFAFELGLPFGWELLETEDAAHLKSDAIRRVLRESSPSEIVNLMHLLDQGDLSWRVASQIRHTIEATHQTFLRSTKNAWEFIEPRESLSDEEIANVLSEFESLASPGPRFNTERENATAAIRAGSFRYVLDKGVGKSLLQAKTDYYNKEIPTSWRAVYDKLISHAQAIELTWIAKKNKATAELVSKFETQYQIAKRLHRQYEFADIPRKLALALHSPESHERLAFRLDGGIEHLLLDEFQDTSPEQWRILENTAKRVSDQSDGTFLCVGDVKQAIYGWRGGSARIFGAIEKQLNKVVIEHLVESRRSAPPVIETVNRVMERIADFGAEGKDSQGMREWAAGFKKHSTSKQELRGWVTLREVAATDEKDDSAKAKLNAALTSAAQIAEETHLSAPGRTIAILFRSNAPIGRMVSLLRQRQLDASEEGGTSLLDSAAVETILSLIQLADHPGDSVARFHLETGPLAKGPEGEEFAAAMVRPAALAAKLRRSLAMDGYGNFVRTWAERLAPFVSLRDATRLEQLIELACNYDSAATLRPSDFVKYVTTTKSKDVAVSSIRVMTIHQSKGLEFDTVILPELDKLFRGREPGCVAGGDDFLAPATRATRWVNEAERPLIPEIMQKDHDLNRDQRVQDSLCTLYVAMTRAVHALHMIIPETDSNSQSRWSDLLQRALVDSCQDGAAGQSNAPGLLYGLGDPDWFRHDSENTATMGESSQFPEWPLIEFKPASANVLRSLPRKKPSTVASETHFDPYTAFRARGSEATRFGTAIHFWFEQIEWIDGAKSSDSLTDLIAKGIVLPTDQLEVWQSKFQGYRNLECLADFLVETRFRKRFSVKGDLIVENEQAIAFLDEDALISGQVDRLIFEVNGGKPCRAWIIDFKTDMIDPTSPDSLAQKSAHHHLQLQAYRRGIAATRQLPLNSVEAYLVLLEAGAVIQIPC